jgi:hypothetical protein
MSDPWRLKLDRAKQHLEQLEANIGTYAARHPYAAVPGPKRHTDHHPNTRRYVVQITEQPDPMLGVIVGEFFFDLRSALDNIVVACAPTKRSRSAGFPIVTEDLWAKDEAGSFVHRDNQLRASFEGRLAGLDADLITVVKELQPYRRGPGFVELDPLAIISRFDNLNKHRGLIVTAGAIYDTATTVSVRGDVIKQDAWGLREDGAEVAYFGLDPAIPEAEVRVEISGTATVTLDIAGREREYFEVPKALVGIPDYVENKVLTELEPFVRR